MLLWVTAAVLSPVIVLWATLLWRRHIRRPADWGFDQFMASGFQFWLLSTLLAAALFGVGRASGEPAVRIACYVAVAAVAVAWVVLELWARR